MIFPRIKRIVFPFLTLSLFFVLTIYDEWLLAKLGLDVSDTVYKILYYTLHILFWITAAFFLNRLLKIFAWEGIAQKAFKGNVPRLLVEIVSLIVYGIALTIITGFVFNKSLTGFWATSSVLAIVLGLALRNIILDLFTGLAINIERPYQLGDWVKIYQRLPEQNIVGQVLEINWRATRIKTEEGAIVVIPNSIMSTSFVTNYWLPDSELRQEVRFSVDFSVPVERMRRILMAAARESLELPGFINKKMPEILIRRASELGIEYEIRFWIHAWRQISPSKAKDLMNGIVLKHLHIAGISPAYPKHDVFHESLPVRQFDTASIVDRKRILSGIDLFIPLPEQEIAQLADRMQYIVFKSGEEIIRKGEEGDSMYILVEGVAEVLVPDGNKMVRLNQLSPGEFFGEMSLLTGELRSADVIAITDTVVYRLEREDLNQTIRLHPEIIEKISEILVERKYQNAKLLEKVIQHAAAKPVESSTLLVNRIRSFFKVTKSASSPQKN